MQQQWIKAGLVGLGGALLMFILMKIGIGADMAPFKVPPSAAFLMSFGIKLLPLAVLLHFLYGAVGSVVLVEVMGEKTDWKFGLALAGIMWLLMMLVVSPIIGWGIFGQSGADLSGKLEMAGGPKYIIVTLVLHILYGLTIGLGNQFWTLKQAPQQDQTATQ